MTIIAYLEIFNNFAMCSYTLFIGWNYYNLKRYGITDIFC